MIGSSKHIILKKTSGQSQKVGMTQKAISDKLDLNDLSIIDLQNAVLELQERQTIFVDYWDVMPTEPQEEEVMYITSYQELSIYFNGEWLVIPPSSLSIYINRDTNVQYAWNGTDMVEMTFPLTKASIEALLTGVISSHSHATISDALKADKLITYTEKTASFVLNNNDSDKWLNCNHTTTEILISIPTGLTNGKQFFFFQKGDAQVSFEAIAGMTALTTKLKLSGKYSACQISIEGNSCKIIGDMKL